MASVLAVLVWAFAGTWLSSQGVPPTPTVVQQIQRLQRLETVIYSMDTIVQGGTDSRYLPRILAGDRLLLMVYGESTAGIDLSRLTTANVTLVGRAIVITLPPPELFSTRLDNARTQIFSRQTGLFSRVDPQLESEVRRAAEVQLRQAALDRGILPTAAANARTTVGQILSGLGFGPIDVR
ncbi:MAG: DUF4230 domain-containing protein [Acidobacteriota bacterium]